MTNLIDKLERAVCRLIGHTRKAGWWGDGLYGDVRAAGTDGCGREHFTVWHTCDRCGERYILARFHGSQVRARSQGGE